MNPRDHWQTVHETKSPSEVSWYAEHLEDSLRLIREVALPQARIIDVGAGASTLVDDLLEAGYRNVTVLDISEAALETSRKRLGDRAPLVEWHVRDITTANLPEEAFDVWHDRAVLHFLTREADRQAYVDQVRRSVAAGGHVVIATFSLIGPRKCSGLEVVRYDVAALATLLGSDFTLTRNFDAKHLTPDGGEQAFLFCAFQKRV